MTCRDIQPLLGALMDDELTAVEASAVREHLESCTACARRASLLGDTRALFRDAAPGPRSALARPPRTAIRRVVHAVLSAAAAVVLVAGAVSMLRSQRTAIDAGTVPRPPAPPASLRGTTAIPLTLLYPERGITVAPAGASQPFAMLPGLDCRPHDPGPNCAVEPPSPCSSAQHCGAY